MAIPTTILPCTHVSCRSPWLETPSPCCLPFSLAGVAPLPGKHILSLDEFLNDTNPESDWITDRDGVQDYVGGNLLDGHGFFLPCIQHGRNGQDPLPCQGDNENQHHIGSWTYQGHGVELGNCLRAVVVDLFPHSLPWAARR